MAVSGVPQWRGICRSRVCFVDVSDLSAPIQYRHVLLVDENYCTFEDMHAWGLDVSPQDGMLHVSDSHSGAKKIHTFDVNFVPQEDREKFYTDVYILVRVASYDVPITHSFLSYDWGVLVATFFQCMWTQRIAYLSVIIVLRGTLRWMWTLLRQAVLLFSAKSTTQYPRRGSVSCVILVAMVVATKAICTSRGCL